jgi:hypothetical protein
MTQLFFLDLEQTIIESWASPDLIYTDPLRLWLHAQGAESVNIFSFALWNEKDKVAFVDRGIRHSIETALGLPVRTYPAVTDMMRAEQQVNHTNFENVQEYIGLRGKKDAFRNYMQCVGSFTRAVLIDDVVPDETITHRRYGWSIEYWNVDTITTGWSPY